MKRYNVVDTQINRVLFETDSYALACRFAFAKQEMNTHNEEWVHVVDNNTGRCVSQVVDYEV